jgi:hypothetical protein
MGTKRQTINRGKGGHLTPDIIAAWKRADFERLHILLRLAPWEVSPFPREIAGPLGCSADDLPLDPENPNKEWEESIPKALEWQRKLLAVAGWPDCRHEYEEKLRDAEASYEWARKRFEHLPAGEYGTGTDLETRRQRMLDAEDEVEYRRELLAGLTRVQKKWARRIKTPADSSRSKALI